MTHTMTFDFHNTLIECDQWFEIEIRSLVSDVLRYWHNLGEIDVPPPVIANADAEYRKLRRAIHGHGHELPADRAVRMILERVDFALPWDAIDIALDAIMRDSFRHARPVTGAPETVQRLAAEGVKLGVVSIAVYHDFLIWSLDRFGMLEAFDTIVTSAASGFYKNRPEIYWSALAGLNAEPTHAVHIGDSLRFDVGGGAQAGMRTVWFQRPDAKDTPSPELMPNLIVPSMSGIAPALLAFLDPA